MLATMFTLSGRKVQQSEEDSEKCSNFFMSHQSFIRSFNIIVHTVFFPYLRVLLYIGYSFKRKKYSAIYKSKNSEKIVLFCCRLIFISTGLFYRYLDIQLGCFGCLSLRFIIQRDLGSKLIDTPSEIEYHISFRLLVTRMRSFS